MDYFCREGQTRPLVVRIRRFSAPDSRSIRRNAGLDDLVRLTRNGAVIMLAALFDGIDMLHPTHHFTPYRILPVKPGRVVEADEELAVGAVGIGGARRRDGTAL